MNPLIPIQPPLRATIFHRPASLCLPAICCVALTLLPAFASAQPLAPNGLEAPPADGDREKAMAYYTNGRELLEQQNFQDAFPQLRLAYELAQQTGSPHAWRILGSLGYCALQLERDGEALQFYRQYLERGADQVPSEERESISREIALIEGNLVTVEVSMAEKQFRVIVSRAGSLAPPQAYDAETGSLKLGLRAGTHVIAVEKDDETLASKRTTVKPGESKLLSFDAAAHESAHAPNPAPAVTTLPPPTNPERDAPPPPSSGLRRLRLTSYVVGGLGVAGLVAGVVVAGRASRERDDAYDAVTGDPTLCRGNVCREDAERRFDKADSLTTTRNVLLMSGGALLATGIGLFLYDLNDEQSNSALRVLPTLGTNSGHLQLSGRF